MSNKSSKKLKRIILILILIILVISLITIILVVNSSKAGEESGLGATNENTDRIIPMSSEGFFQRYYGTVDENDVYKTLTLLANYIIDNKEEIDTWNDDSMYTVYSENEEEFKNMGLVYSEDFVNVMKLVQEINTEDLDLSYMAFENDTIAYALNGIQVDITFKYVNVDGLNLELMLLNDANTENPIRINTK